MQFQQIRSATSIVTFNQTRFLIDPCFAPKGALPSIPSPYNKLKNPLVDLPLPIEELIKVDAVIVTHMHHFDHFDNYAADALPKDIPMFTQSEKEADDMGRLGFTNVTAMTEDGVDFNGTTLHRTEALHGDGVNAAYYYKKYGVPGDACGVVFCADDEKSFYIAGDTLWYEGVRKTIEQYQPAVITLSPANAQLYNGTPLLMGMEGVSEVAAVAPDAILIANHMDALNHTHVSRADLAEYSKRNHLEYRLFIPEDGEVLDFSVSLLGAI